MTKAEKIAADYIRELIDTTITTERIDRFVPVPNITEPPWHLPAWTRTREAFAVTHPSLIEQLRESTVQAKDGDFAGGSAKSKPAARLDAVAVLQRIDKESKALATELDVYVPHLYNRLSAISGAVGNNDHPTVKAWWIAARCATGWEQPPYQPDVPCPNVECEIRGGLRIRLDDAIASCVHCGASWGAETYGVLGEYVKWASEHLTGPKHVLYDADGYPKDCEVCQDERLAMEGRKEERKRRKAA